MEGDGNGFTNKEILLRLDDKVDIGFEDLKRLFIEGHADHEKRIRGMEAWRYRVMGMAAFCAFLTPAAITIALTKF
jgi:hypothetical protein